jgi:hypothetical protein
MRHYGLLWLILAVSVLVAGCSQGDPSSSRLSAGQKVIAVPHGSDSEPIYIHDASNNLFTFVNPGTNLLVISDDDKRDWDSRPVLVRVEEGEYQGVTGKPPRWNLRPIK